MRATGLLAAAAISLRPIVHATPARAQATFGAPVAVDDSRPAGEPGIIVDNSGRVFVNAPPGLPGPSDVWPLDRRRRELRLRRTRDSWRLAQWRGCRDWRRRFEPRVRRREQP